MTTAQIKWAIQQRKAGWQLWAVARQLGVTPTQLTRALQRHREKLAEAESRRQYSRALASARGRRNRAILRALADGLTPAAVAQAFGMSANRIRELRRASEKVKS